MQNMLARAAGGQQVHDAMAATHQPLRNGRTAPCDSRPAPCPANRSESRRLPELLPAARVRTADCASTREMRVRPPETRLRLHAASKSTPRRCARRVLSCRALPCDGGAKLESKRFRRVPAWRRDFDECHAVLIPERAARFVERPRVSQAAPAGAQAIALAQRTQASDGVAVVVDIDDRSELAGPQQNVGLSFSGQPAARHPLHGERGSHRSEQVSTVERRGQPLRPPGDAKTLALARPLPNEGQKPIIRTDEALTVGVDDDRVALAADTGIDDGQKYRIAGIFAGQGAEQVCRRLDAEVGRVVQSVDHGNARCARGENRLDLPYVEIARPEIGEENDQAALADFFSSLFASFFFFFSSGFGSGVSSGRSISVTSASGALSPLRKPLLRMRR